MLVLTSYKCFLVLSSRDYVSAQSKLKFMSGHKKFSLIYTFGPPRSLIFVNKLIIYKRFVCLLKFSLSSRESLLIWQIEQRRMLHIGRKIVFVSFHSPNKQKEASGVTSVNITWDTNWKDAIAISPRVIKFSNNFSLISCCLPTKTKKKANLIVCSNTLCQ